MMNLGEVKKEVLKLYIEVNYAKNLAEPLSITIDSPLIFVRFTSNFLCMFSDRVARTHVILM